MAATELAPERIPTKTIAEQPAKAAERFYRPELDGLRFFAFFAVFVYHSLPRSDALYARHGVSPLAIAALGALSRSGRFGVDLFFVLSGYLITELLLREHATYQHIDIRAFYVRRALRIWPIYFLTIGLGLLVALVDKGQPFSIGNALWFVFFSGNWAVGLGLIHSSVVIPLWTVNVEEQFYLAWPWLIRNPSPRRIVRAAGVLVVIAFVARIGWYALAPAAYANCGANDTLAHLDPIAIGCALAVLLRSRAPLALRTRVVTALFGVGCVATAGLLDRETPSSALIVAPLAAVGCTAVFIASLVESGKPSILKHSALVYLGRISYGLYIYHYLVLVLATAAFAKMGMSLGSVRGFGSWWCLCLAATIALAAISYGLIERPFLRLKTRFARIQSRPTPGPRETGG